MMMRSEMPLREYKKLSKSELRAKILAFFEKAQTSKELTTSNALVRRAQKIVLATKTRLPRELKRRFCRHCGAYLVSGKNATIRTQRGKVVFRCLECKHMSRIPYVREKKAKREQKRASRERQRHQ